VDDELTDFGSQQREEDQSADRCIK
jgi:hypothetical protein